MKAYLYAISRHTRDGIQDTEETYFASIMSAFCRKKTKRYVLVIIDIVLFTANMSVFAMCKCKVSFKLCAKTTAQLQYTFEASTSAYQMSNSEAGT